MKTGKFKILFLASMVLLLFGCTPKIQRLLGQLPEPENQIAIHQIIQYPRAKTIERQIPTFSGRTIWINVNSFIHSSAIKKVELVPRGKSGKYYDLKLFMNRRGRLHWMSLCNAFKNEKVAFVIDGTFYRSFYPKPMVGEYDTKEDTTYVLIEGPFDKGTADALEEWAPKNFQYYNDEDDEF